MAGIFHKPTGNPIDTFIPPDPALLLPPVKKSPSKQKFLRKMGASGYSTLLNQDKDKLGNSD